MKTNEISKLLKKHDIKVFSYKKENDFYVVDTNKGKFFVYENINNKYIYNYLNTRSFDNYPKILIDDNYKISKYIEDTDIPDEQKYNDLIDLVSSLHSKTKFNKRVINDEYNNIYEKLERNYNYLFDYYNKIIDIIDHKIFLSPSDYLIARNIGLVFDSLDLGKNYLEELKEDTEKVDKMKVSIINNNLTLSNFRRSDKSYLINWNKAKIDIPIFDLYNFFQNNYNVDYFEILKRYEKKYPLQDIEKKLLFVLLLMPNLIDFNTSEYNMCKNIRINMNKLINTQFMISKYKKSITKD